MLVGWGWDAMKETVCASVCVCEREESNKGLKEAKGRREEE